MTTAPDIEGSIDDQTADVNFRITQRPDFAMLRVRLEAGQKIHSEPSAMAAMSQNIKLKAGFKGGFMKTVGRSFGGESLIVSTYTAEDEPGEVLFAAGQAGDTMHYHLDGNSLMLQRGAFLAHTEGVEVGGSWQGARGFFSGEGLVLLKAVGFGDVFFNSYGAILELDVTDGYYVDTGYIVAFEDTLDYEVTVLPGLKPGFAKGVKRFFFGGEGLVCRFRGQGRVWVQTRFVFPFLNFVNPYRPTKND